MKIPKVVKSLAGIITFLGFSLPISHAQSLLIDYATPDADSYIHVGNAATNYGSGSAMSVQNAGSGSNRRMAYIRYDLFANDAEELLLNGRVQTAELTFRLSSLQTDKAASTLLVYGLKPDFHGGEGVLGQDWGELAITGQNAPWAAPSNSNVPDYVTLLGSVAIPARQNSTNPAPGTEYSFSSQALADFINASLSSGQPHSNLVTLMVFELEFSGKTSSWVTKEHETFNPTSLSIHVIPEPATTSLLLIIGGVGLAYTFRGRSRVSP